MALPIAFALLLAFALFLALKPSAERISTQVPASALAAQGQAEDLLKAANVGSSRFTADQAALPHSVSDLSRYGVRLSKGDGMEITWKTGHGYCLNAFNSGAEHSKNLATAVRYDSVTGEYLKSGEEPNPKGACTLA